MQAIKHKKQRIILYLNVTYFVNIHLFFIKYI